MIKYMFAKKNSPYDNAANRGKKMSSQYVQFIALCFISSAADNRKKTRRTLARQDFSMFNTPEANSVLISPQLALAAFRFLSTCKWQKSQFKSNDILW